MQPPESQPQPTRRQTRSGSARSQVVACRFANDDVEALHTLAAERGVTVAALIREQVAPLLRAA